MRRTTSSAWVLGVSLMGGGLALQGCSSLFSSSASQAKPADAQPKAPTTMPASASGKHGAPTAEQEVSTAAQQQADRLTKAMGTKGKEPVGTGASATDGSPADGIPDVRWIDLRAEARQQRPSMASGNAPASIDADAPGTPGTPGAGGSATQPSNRSRHTPAGPTQTGSWQHVDRRVLVARLIDEIRAGHDPAMAKALASAGLSLADPGRGLDAADLSELTEPQRQQVRRFYDLVNSLARQLDAGGKLPEGDALVSQVDGLTGNLPVRVRSVKLCRRVNGYGVYDAFETNTFVAGHEQPVIVYVELDQFRANKGPDDLFHVKLSQEVTLYNEADGLAVWRQPSVEIADDSHNRRHDFFLVQLVRLPANLGVGKFRLNVRVTDMADSSLDEFKVPIQIVADASLVSSKTNP